MFLKVTEQLPYGIKFKGCQDWQPLNLIKKLIYIFHFLPAKRSLTTSSLLPGVYL